MPQNEVDSTNVPSSSTDNEFFKVERRGLEPVPDPERHGTPRDLAPVWAGAMTNYVSLLTGALVIGAPAALLVTGGKGQLGLVDSSLAIILGAALAALVHGLVSATGARTGTPQMIFARGVFGHRGAYISAALTWIMAVGWFAIDCIIGGWALVQLLSIFGIPKTTEVALGAITLVLIASVVVAVFGHRTVHVFEKFGSLVFLAFCILLFIILLPKVHWNQPTTVHGLPRFAALVVGGSYIYALVASWIPFASDYSRYLPRTVRPRRVAWWSGLGIGLPTALLGILGVILSTIDVKNTDLLSVITQATPPWLTVPFLLFVVLGEIWANYFDVYTAGLVALAMDIPLKRWVSALLCGGIGAVCVYGIGLLSHFNQAETYTDLTQNFLGFYVNFLLLTYLWVPAWAAILIVDFFIFRRGHYAANHLTLGRKGIYWFQGGVAWRALCAWLIGFLITIPFIGSAYLPGSSTPWHGPLAALLGGMDLSGIIGGVVSGILYFLLGYRAHQRAKDVTFDEAIEHS